MIFCAQAMFLPSIWWGILSMISVLSCCKLIQTASQLVREASGTFLTPCWWLEVMLRCHNEPIARSGPVAAVLVPQTEGIIWFSGRPLKRARNFYSVSGVFFRRVLRLFGQF